jgi:hypothetical protein
VTALPAKALDFAYRDSLDAYIGNRLPHIVEFEWLDDRRDHFHRWSPAFTSLNEQHLPASSRLPVPGF